MGLDIYFLIITATFILFILPFLLLNPWQLTQQNYFFMPSLVGVRVKNHPFFNKFIAESFIGLQERFTITLQFTITVRQCLVGKQTNFLHCHFLEAFFELPLMFYNSLLKYFIRFLFLSEDFKFFHYGFVS